MVHIVGTIIQDFVFEGLISFLSPIFHNWDLVNGIYTDIISMCHIQHLLYLRIATQTTLCWEVKETPYFQGLYGQIDGEDNTYKRTYTHD